MEESPINGLFNVSINEGEATLNTSNDKILKGNQLKVDPLLILEKLLLLIFPSLSGY